MLTPATAATGSGELFQDFMKFPVMSEHWSCLFLHFGQALVVTKKFKQLPAVFFNFALFIVSAAATQGPKRARRIIGSIENKKRPTVDTAGAKGGK